MDRQHDAETVGQVGGGVADHLGRDHVLVVGLGVHEVEPFSIGIEKVVRALVDEGALDLLGGAIAFGDLHPIGDAAHVQLGHRGALAGVDVFDVEDDIELAVDIDDRALAE
jgi:hypothetical protein